MSNISRFSVMNVLRYERDLLVGQLDSETDVRLVVEARDDDVLGTTWHISSGDVSYDTVHGIACGAGTLHVKATDDEIAALADDLISQVEDQLAEASDE